jgi:hypothetical protein
LTENFTFSNFLEIKASCFRSFKDKIPFFRLFLKSISSNGFNFSIEKYLSRINVARFYQKFQLFWSKNVFPELILRLFTKKFNFSHILHCKAQFFDQNFHLFTFCTAKLNFLYQNFNFPVFCTAKLNFSIKISISLHFTLQKSFFPHFSSKFSSFSIKISNPPNPRQKKIIFFVFLNSKRQFSAL